MAAADVDEYLRGLDEPRRVTLQSLRSTILEIVPEAEEVISLLGSLEGDALLALREYEVASQGREPVLRAIDGVLQRREPAGTR